MTGQQLPVCRRVPRSDCVGESVPPSRRHWGSGKRVHEHRTSAVSRLPLCELLGPEGAMCGEPETRAECASQACWDLCGGAAGPRTTSAHVGVGLAIGAGLSTAYE